MIDTAAIECARQTEILALARRLGAKLRKVGLAEWAGACPRCGGADRFSVNTREQIFNCRMCLLGGDAIALARRVRDLSFAEAVEFLTGEDGKQEASAPKTSVKPDDERRKAFIRGTVSTIVRELVPLRKTPGELYLAEVRKIDTAAITDVIERVDAIGWHRSVLFRELGHALDGKRLGCVVGVMTDPVTAEPSGAISRTYLHDGLKVGKAKSLGSPASIVRLSADEDVVEGLCLAEGLETCLAVMAKGFRPAWACGSAGLMAAFPVLAGVEALTLFADNDAIGTGLRAANQAAARWRAAGRETHIYLREVLGDFNDVLLETGR